MRIMHSNKLQIFRQQTCKVLLCVCWMLGLVFGAVFSAGADSTFLLLMRRTEFSVSIVGLLLVAMLPFLFTAYAFFLSNRFLIIIFAFLKAFSFSYCLFGLSAVYGTGSWLAWILLMFSDLGTLPVLMWLWIHFLGSPERSIRTKFVCCLSVSALIVMADYWMISPFAASIL